MSQIRRDALSLFFRSPPRHLTVDSLQKGRRKRGSTHKIWLTVGCRFKLFNERSHWVSMIWKFGGGFLGCVQIGLKGCEIMSSFEISEIEKRKKMMMLSEEKTFPLMWNWWGSFTLKMERKRKAWHTEGKERRGGEEVMCSPRWSASPPSVSSSLLMLLYKRPPLPDSSLSSPGIRTPSPPPSPPLSSSPPPPALSGGWWWGPADLLQPVRNSQGRTQFSGNSHTLFLGFLKLVKPKIQRFQQHSLFSSFQSLPQQK